MAWLPAIGTKNNDSFTSPYHKKNNKMSRNTRTDYLDDNNNLKVARNAPQASSIPDSGVFIGHRCPGENQYHGSAFDTWTEARTDGSGDHSPMRNPTTVN